MWRIPQLQQLPFQAPEHFRTIPAGRLGLQFGPYASRQVLHFDGSAVRFGEFNGREGMFQHGGPIATLVSNVEPQEGDRRSLLILMIESAWKTQDLRRVPPAPVSLEEIREALVEESMRFQAKMLSYTPQGLKPTWAAFPRNGWFVLVVYIPRIGTVEISVQETGVNYEFLSSFRSFEKIWGKIDVTCLDWRDPDLGKLLRYLDSDVPPSSGPSLEAQEAKALALFRPDLLQKLLTVH